MSLPSSVLVAPQADEVVPDIANQILGIQDKVSISYALNALIDWVTGFNPFEEFAEEFTGEWEEFARASGAMTAMGRYYAEYGAAVGDAAERVAGSWTGQAATAAQAYFAELAGALSATQAAFDALAQDFRSTVAGITFATQAMMSALQELCDLAIALALELLAAASTAWTGVGGLIGGAAAAYTAWEAKQVWLEVLKWHGRAVAGATGLSGLMAASLSLIKGLEAQPLPAAAYDHRQA